MKKKKKDSNFLNVKKNNNIFDVEKSKFNAFKSKKSLLTLKKIILKKDYQNIYNIDKKI